MAFPSARTAHLLFAEIEEVKKPGGGMDTNTPESHGATHCRSHPSTPRSLSYNGRLQGLIRFLFGVQTPRLNR